MSTHNNITLALTCPRCGCSEQMDAELFFGFGNLIDYKLGDEVHWVPFKAPQNGGRPVGGNMDGEGYVECPKCKKDFYVKAVVRSDVLEMIELDTKKEPLIL